MRTIFLISIYLSIDAIIAIALYCAFGVWPALISLAFGLPHSFWCLFRLMKR